MDPNELVQNAPTYAARLMFAVLIAQIAGTAVGGWVVFMFYSRLREIAEEVRKLRIAYEFAQGRRGTGELRTRAGDAFRPGGAGDQPAAAGDGC